MNTVAGSNIPKIRQMQAGLAELLKFHTVSAFCFRVPCKNRQMVIHKILCNLLRNNTVAPK